MQFISKVVCFFLLIQSFVFPSESIVHNVDVISGKLHLSYTDHIVQGPVPIPIERTFYTIHQQRKNDDLFIAEMERIGIFPHLCLYIRQPSSRYGAEIIEKGSGKNFYRVITSNKKEVTLEYGNVHPHMYSKFPNHGYPIDDSRSMQNGFKNNQKNNRICIRRKEKQAIMYLADGTIRYYKAHGPNRSFQDKITGNYWKIRYQYLLEKEIAPDGQTTLFEFKKEEFSPTLTIKKVSPHDNRIFSWVKIRYIWEAKSTPKVELTTSDNKKITYKTFFSPFGRKTTGLQSVERENLPTQTFTYLEHKEGANSVSLLKKVTCGKDSLEIEYSLPKYTSSNYRNYEEITYDPYASY